MSEEHQKVPFYKKSWFIILTLIFFFPVGLYLMWVHTDWNRKAKWIITAIVALFAFSTLFGEDDTSNEIADSGNEQVASEESESEEAVPAEEEPEATEEEPIEEEAEEEPIEEPAGEESETVAEEESAESDVISIAESENYVIEAELIEEEYTLGSEEDIEVFSPENEEHYRIQMDHHGGLLGSQNLDRIQELIENISEENAEYDYLVFEILRTDREDGERWVYTRFTPAQAEDLLNEDEVDDETFEQVADFFVSGGEADIGFTETAINYEDMTTEEMIDHAAAENFGESVQELTVNESDAGVTVNALVRLGESWSASSAVSNMRYDMAQFLGDLQNFDLTYENVAITYEGELVDQAGNESINDVLITEYGNDTIHEINVDNIGIVSENMDSLANYWWLHPAFHEE